MPASSSFFKILEEQQVPLSDLDSKLREIAAQYKELLARVGDDQAAKAKQAIEAGDYAKAEKLLEDAANQHSLVLPRPMPTTPCCNVCSSAMLRQPITGKRPLLPEDEKKDRAYYLNAAGYDLYLYHIAKYKEALHLYEQALAIHQKIGDREGEGTTLNNISRIYHDWGDYATALKYLKQSLRICRETGNRVVEGVALNNIGEVHRLCGNYDIALPFYEQSLCISQEIGDKDKEWSVLNNIGLIYHALGNYAAALRLYEQSLTISREINNLVGEWTILNNIGQTYQAQVAYAAALTSYKQSLNICTEIGDRRGEALTRWNIGCIYEVQGYLRKAECYISQAVQIEDEIGHPDLEEDRHYLKYIRAKLRGR